MAELPPPPDGFEPDPLGTIESWGVAVTNGFRTPADTERLRRKGYRPANDSLHLDADAVDLTPGKSGMSMTALHNRARALAARWPGAKVLNEGDHVHIQLPGWGGAPGLPEPPEGFEPVTAGAASDGDTFKLSDGRNGRLFGADAYELGQQGRRSTGALVPLGVQARDLMQSRIPGLPFTPTGGQSYGRPVGSFGGEGNDPAQTLLRNGLGLAAPEYLEGSPQFGPYMEAERLARLNRLGGFQTNAETPDQFRDKSGPWKGAEPGQWGKGQAVFWDEPTPFQGLRPEIEKGLMQLWRDPNATADEILAYAKANGFIMPEAETQKRVKLMREGGAPAADKPIYQEPPPLLINPGDETTGAAARGLADPLNMIDELGALADTVGIPSPGAGGPREGILNSDRRFGDILWNNIDQNRAVLGYDEQAHPYARFGGQLASGLAIPVVGVEGVGARAAAKALESGLSGFAAEQAARIAVAKRLAAVGGAEGGAIGFGGAEGNPLERLPSAAVGAAAGAVAAPLVGEAIGAGAGLLRRLRSGTALSDGVVPPPGDEIAGARPYIEPDTLQRISDAAPDAPAAPYIAPAQIQKVNGGYAAMAADAGPSIASSDLRPRDYLDIGDLPPPPEGFAPEAPFGVTRPMGERLSPEEMAKLAEGVDPRSVLPRPGNRVETLAEAEKANPSRLVEIEAPDEFAELGVRKVPSRKDFYKFTRVRGPLDMTQRLRTMGGIQDQGGELAHLGITNDPRRMDFGSNEQFLGKLVDNENGMPLDEATFRLWEDGYFPEFQERPTPNELLDRLKLEQMGQRFFDPADAEEVARFEAAQAERFRIEGAKQEGSPLVDERGETINLDDLVANTPPAEAYEEMPRLTGRVGNINLARLERPQDVAQLINQVASRVGGFSAAARGKITHEETIRLAEELGLKPEQLLKRRQGQALNAEQLYAARSLVQKSREVVGQLAKKAVGGSDEDLSRFRGAWLRHVALEEQASGATAEAARALSQQRAIAKGASADARAVRDYLKASGGRERIEDAAQAIVDLIEDPAKANHFMREAVKPRWRDKFNELWINSLLSGPTTHAVNMVGNALTTALSFPETAVAAGIGKLTRSADRVFFREVGARAAGLADSSVEALRAARKAFATGEASDEVTKVEQAHHRAIGGRVGNIIRTPTRALTAADEFWSGLLRGAELRQIAYRKAAGEATDAADLRVRYEALRKAPTDEMRRLADDSARYYTFRRELGTTGKAIQQISNNWVGGKLVVPFVRTPINILKFAGERSVLAIAMPEVRAALKAGGRARDEALAKITLGSGLSTAAVVAAMDGRITGNGPTDPRERAALLQSGWQPYSIRIGDKWVSYSRFDPVSTLFGVAADFAEAGKWATKKEADVIALELATSIAKNITNKTWLSGLSDAFDVLSDPERYGQNYFERLAGSLAVPSLANQTARSTDPFLRDARTIMDAIKARVPVLSESVPARLNVWGEPIERGSAVGPDIVSPFYTTKATDDPVKREIARLRVPLSMPQRHITVDRQRVNLTPQQYADYVRLSGQPAKAWLDRFVKSGEWRAMSADERREEVVETLKEFRAAARDELVARYPDLGSKAPAGARRATGDLPPPPPGFVPVGAAR